MGLGSLLCGGLESRRRGAEDVDEDMMPVPGNPKSETDAAPAADLASGTFGLHDYAVEVSREVLQDSQTDPWYSLPNFGQFVLETRRRVRLGLMRRDRISVQEANGVPSNAPISVPQHHSNEVQQTDEAGRFEGPAQKGVDGGNGGEYASTGLLSPSLSVLMTATSGQGTTSEANDELGNIRPGAVFLNEAISSPESENVSGVTSPSTKLEVAGGTTSATARVRIESELEFFPDSQPILDNEPVEASSETATTKSSVHPPIAPSRQDSDDWCTSPGMIMNAAGELKAEWFFYDTGSPDSWAAKKLAERHNIPLRPILPERLTEYRTIGNEIVIPRFYIEAWMKDEHNGMVQFKKVSLNITESMGGRGLLLGRAFMREHGVTLDPRQGPGVYVFTAREASDGKGTQTRCNNFD